MRVTLWFKREKCGNLTFNHMELGHSLDNKPKPKFSTQSSWLNQEWVKKHCRLTNDSPPVVLEEEISGE